ncbi:MAG: hypothetical protein Q7U47_14780, partial [Paludibacter sp.]|nr:hypothetical protein [Paludibacter sp.]
ELIVDEITSIDKLIEVMNPTQEEMELIQRLEGLATGINYATTEDFENIFKTKGTTDGIQKSSKSVVGVVLIGVGVIAVVGVTAYLVAKMCENRTYDKIKDYYGISKDDVISGTKVDAFKHTCVSMLLCSYLTQPSAWAIMGYYEIANPNKPCDKYMDFHNNSVGRDTKYWTFRGPYFNNLFNWQTWTLRVCDFINNSGNGIKMNWATFDDVNNIWLYNISESDIISTKNNADKNKYIYWNPF